MTSVRHLLSGHRILAAMIVLAALSLRILVPAGFMPVTARDGTITMQICTGTQGAPMTIAMAIPGLPGGEDDHRPAKAEMPCAFAGLAMPMLSGADAVLLALAIAFVMALAGHVGDPVRPRREPRLRPPLRGPPIPA